MTAPDRYTPEEYLALERNATFRSEYIDGRITSMRQGESRPHNLIVSALISEIGSGILDGPCELYANAMRVKVIASGDYVYPDLVVSCDPQFEDEMVDTLLTPVLVLEVLSEFTEAHDRGKKFSLYRRIDTLREYVLISQWRPLVEQYVREGAFWRLRVMDDGEASITLASVGFEIPLRRIYAKALTPARRALSSAGERG
jgi:Uma2 family endonuclease